MVEHSNSAMRIDDVADDNDDEGGVDNVVARDINSAG